MELKKKLGKRIKELRIKNNLTQAQLAEKVGIATKSQSSIERGINYPSADLVEKYATVFCFEVSELFKLDYFKNTESLLKEINFMINKADDKEVVIIYKFLSGLLY